MMSANHNHHSASNIKIAFFLNLCFAIFELIGGLFTNSLAILSDSVHDLGDAFALGMSWYLDKASKKPRSEKFTYGLGRFSLLSALLSSFVLLVGSVYVLTEAIPRLLNPQHSNAQGMVGFAIVGIVINCLAVFRLKKGVSMNERVVFWHLLEDVLGWVAVLVTGIFIYFKDIHILDPILSIGIVLFILWNVIKNLKKTVTLFLQGVPDGVSVDTIEQGIKSVPDVVAVHDTHVWTIDGDSSVLSTHIVMGKSVSDERAVDIKCQVKENLAKQHIEHATIETEREGEKCELNNH